jgi:hypothetical protein
MKTIKPVHMALLVSVVACMTQKGAPTMSAPTTPAAPVKSGHLAVNGLSYYYEVRGHGEPLLLLHGGLGSIEMFGPVLAKLAERRTVIGVDLQGHGRTPLGDRGGAGAKSWSAQVAEQR